MTNTVTINIQNNCCCGDGSSTARTGDIEISDPPWLPTIIKDAPEGPPSGYLQASTLTDRQCRAAIFTYQMVYNAIDQLANSALGSSFVLFASNKTLPLVATKALALLIAPIIVAALAAIATGGIDITDAVTGPVAWVIALYIVNAVVSFISENNVTVELLQDIVTKMPAIQDDFICVLSRVSDSDNAYTQVAAVLRDPAYQLTDNQQGFVMTILGYQIGYLWYTPEWWPSFDTATLTSITANCCGSFTDGQPLLPSGQEGCQTAYYLIDKLILSLSGVQDYYNWYWLTAVDFNRLDDDQPDVLKHVTAELPEYIPAKVITKATNAGAFYDAVAGYINVQIYGWWGKWSSLGDYNWSDLASHLQTQRSAIHTALQAALDENDVYNAFYNIIDSWLAANVTDVTLSGYIRTAVNGLIEPPSQLSSLMFYQDSDISGYLADDCAGGSDPYTPGPAGTSCAAGAGVAVYDFTQSPYNWSIIGSVNAETAAYIPGTGFRFASSQNATTLRGYIQQSVPHEYRAVRVYFLTNPTWGSPAAVRTLGTTAGNATAGAGVEDHSGDAEIICVDTGQYATVVVQRFENQPYVIITKLEFYNPDV